jgi:hypothetical protein
MIVGIPNEIRTREPHKYIGEVAACANFLGFAKIFK